MDIRQNIQQKTSDNGLQKFSGKGVEMFKSLDTVPEEYFYLFLAARDAGKRKRLKVYWGGIYVTGLFLLFSSLFVYNSHPRVNYSYYFNLVYIVLFAIQIFGLLLFSIPGFAGKHQKLYWIFVPLTAVICLQLGGINACVAVMGLEALPYGFFLLMLCVLFGAILLNHVVIKRVIKRIPQGYFKEKGTGLFDDKNGKIKKRGAIVSMLISSFTLPFFIFLYLTFRVVHVSNAFLLVFISFMSVFLLIIMSFINYFPILQIYCVNRFPTAEFTAPRIKKNKNRTSIGAL